MISVCVLYADEISQENSHIEGEKEELDEGEEEDSVNEYEHVYLIDVCEVCELGSYYYIKVYFNVSIHDCVRTHLVDPDNHYINL